MIIPLKKTLNNAGHIDAKLIDFSEICPKKSSKIGCFFTDCFLAKFSPKFPVKSADFPNNLPLKILRNLNFFRWNQPIFLRILTLLPWKSCKIGRFVSEFWLFSREIGGFFHEFAPENPAKFCFFFRKISEALYKPFSSRKGGSTVQVLNLYLWPFLIYLLRSQHIECIARREPSFNSDSTSKTDENSWWCQKNPKSKSCPWLHEPSWKQVEQFAEFIFTSQEAFSCTGAGNRA